MMSSVTERKVLVRPAMDVDRVRVREYFWIAVGGAVEDHHPLTLGDVCVANDDVTRCGARKRWCGRLEAEELVDGRGAQPGLVSQLLE